MTVPEEHEAFAEICDRVWAVFCARGIREGGPQELHVSWRCPTVAAAEALEAALRSAGTTVGVAQPNAEAGGRGFGVAAAVPVLASRENIAGTVTRMIRPGADHGATVAGVGTMFTD